MKHSKFVLVIVLIGIALVMTACGADVKASENPAPESVGDPQIGGEIFVERHGEAPSCSYCHSVTDEQGIGPSLKGIADRASTQVDGMDTVTYLRESILDPNAFVVGGGSRSRMYAHFDELLSDEDIDNLIAYLLTLD